MPKPNKMSVAADTVVFNSDKSKVLLVKRKFPPFKGKYALPGGFVEIDENLDVAAKRELFEETSLKVKKVVQVGAFGNVGRDPRGRNIGIAYTTIVNEKKVKPKANDDAKEVKWFNVKKLPRLGFDHNLIIKEAVKKLNQAASSNSKIVSKYAFLHSA